MDLQLLIPIAGSTQLIAGRVWEIRTIPLRLLVVFRTVLGSQFHIVVAVRGEAVVLLTAGTVPFVLVQVRHPCVLVAEPAVHPGPELAPARRGGISGVELVTLTRRHEGISSWTGTLT